MLLFVDTETTGVTRLAFVTRRNLTQWPRLVQIAWALGDEEGLGLIHSILIRPDGFEIPPEVSRIHRITQAHAMAEGQPLAQALQRFNEVLSQATVVVAHNFRFDVGILRAEALRQNPPLSLDWPKAIICTMQYGQAFLVSQLGRRNPGHPSLSNLYQTMFGFDFYPKHSASSDVRACAHVFFKMRSLGIIKLASTP
jgi:DNA polymerase III subunit epsilon